MWAPLSPVLPNYARTLLFLCLYTAHTYSFSWLTSRCRVLDLRKPQDEGNPPDYQDLLGDVLQRRGYDVLISGKTDWSAGGHSMDVRLNSWTMCVVL